MRYIPSLVTRTRQTDKIPMNLILDAINHTLASAYGIEFESVLPTYLCDCNYKNFKTSSFHKQFNPCHNCLIIDLEKTVSRTFRYTNKSDVRVKDPITEVETVYLFFPDEEPKIEINSTDKIHRGFVGEDLEGRALPKELIAEFKKDDDWDDYNWDADDSSWESYDYDSDYEFGKDTDYQSDSINNTEFKSDIGDEKSVREDQEPDNNSDNSDEELTTEISLDSKEYDFQILQQIKSKKYILDVDQRITITNVSTIYLEKVPTNEEHEDLQKWTNSLKDFIRCGWCRINILRNSGDGDKELCMIANQLRLMAEAYQKIFSLEAISTVVSEEPNNIGNAEWNYSITILEKELMSVLKKMVTLGKEKEAMLTARNWITIIKELFPSEPIQENDQLSDEDFDSSNVKQSEKRQLLLADVLAVLGVLEFRRNQPDKAAEHILESINLAYQHNLSQDEKLDLFAYLSEPGIRTTSNPWLLTDTEAQRLGDLLLEKAPHYLNPKMQWLLYESVLSYRKNKKSDMDPKEKKKSVALMKKMLKESKSLINEDKEFYVPKAIQLYCDIAQYYTALEDWKKVGEYVSEGCALAAVNKDFVPLELTVSLGSLSISFAENMKLPSQELIYGLVPLCKELYKQNQDFDSFKKLVNAFLDQIGWNVERLEMLLLRDEEYDEEEEGYLQEEDGEDYQEEEEIDEDEQEDLEDEDDEEDDGEPFFDIFGEDDDDFGSKSRMEEFRNRIERDIPEVECLIQEYRENYLEEEEENPGIQTQQRELQILEIRLYILKAKYLSLDENEEKDHESFELYQDLNKRISELIEHSHDQKLYDLYKTIVSDSEDLYFRLEKFNEIKKVFKQQIAYQKNVIASLPQKSKEFRSANLELAVIYTNLSAYYCDLQTYDRAIKYIQMARELVDKYTDMKVEKQVEAKKDVYGLLNRIGEDTDRDDLIYLANKELDKIDRDTFEL